MRDKGTEEQFDLDAMIASAAAKKGGGWSSWLDQLTSGVLQRRHASWRDLFDNTQSSPARRRTSMILLRLLATNDDPYRDAEFRVATLSLFDSEITDIYKICETEAKAQGYEKLQKLAGYVPRAEKLLEDGLSVPHSVTGLSSFRQGAMQTLKSSVVSPLLAPFVDSKLYRDQFNEVLSAMSVFVDADEVSLHESWDDFDSTADRVKNSLLAAHSKYGLLLASTVNDLHELLAAHFDASPANQPASITVAPSEKKQPLHQVGRIDLRLRVRNGGPGIARDLRLELAPTSEIVPVESSVYLGALAPGEMLASMSADIIQPLKDPILVGSAKWTDQRGDARSEEFIFQLERQRHDIDWDRLQTIDIYALEPVESDQGLVGRRETIDSLQAMAEAPRVGNAYIFGQKRVGKTSIAKTLRNRLLTMDHGHSHLVLYIEAGDYVASDPSGTISALGELICEEVAAADPRFAQVPVPAFDKGLAPLNRYLRGVWQIDPSTRITIMLDEFDSMPPELFRRSEIGDAFFQTLRSVAGKPNCGLVLIGGENMQLILASQGESLNKFKQIRVDYFERSSDWPDYVDLVRRPAIEWLEISDDGVVALYEYTSGNPFFTNLVCGSLASIMVGRRDSHATRTEVDEAVRQTTGTIGSPSFAHFWSDGIFGTGPEAESVSLARRRVLLGLSDCLRKMQATTPSNIVEAARHFGIGAEEVTPILSEFKDRQVLLKSGDEERCRVPLFERWLKERGQHEIVTSSVELAAFEEFISKENSAYVSEAETVALAERWGTFKGQEIGSEAIRAWLAQFGSMRNQRLMFRLLQGVRFYSSADVRARLHDAHGMVARSLSAGAGRDQFGRGKQRRSDVLLSHLDQVGKSGPMYARWYADENAVYIDHIVSRDRLKPELLKSSAVEAVVFVDDFIGSGQAASECVRLMSHDFKDGFPAVAWIFVAISGFEKGARALERVASDAGMGLEVRLCDPLGPSDKCFEGESVYPDPVDRAEAKAIAYEYGRKLVPKDPLGYRDGQALVVFDGSIPNNCPPILWHSGGDWTPLFRRV
jgi:hypothetical protein